jgi:hypothetical protein
LSIGAEDKYLGVFERSIKASVIPVPGAEIWRQIAPWCAGAQSRKFPLRIFWDLGQCAPKPRGQNRLGNFAVSQGDANAPILRHWMRQTDRSRLLLWVRSMAGRL